VPLSAKKDVEPHVTVARAKQALRSGRIGVTGAALLTEGKDIEVNLSPAKEVKLQQFASRTGRPPSQLVAEAVDRISSTMPINAVEEGREAARRGDLLEHDDVGTDRADLSLVMHVRWTTRASDDLTQSVKHPQG
jgi:predicted transcriptional regulator